MKTWIVASAATALAALTFDARADLPGPNDYVVLEDPPGRVSIFLLSHGTPTCPETGLLRKDVGSGEVVRITACEGGMFTDECVPAGVYQYGLAEPYACDGRDAYYYRQATIAGFSDVCVRQGDPPEPVDEVPWEGRSRLVCGEAGCGTTGAGVLGMNLVLLLAGAVLWRWRAARRPGV
jgi:hypothetical protein